jgi:hypothetical protein
LNFKNGLYGYLTKYIYFFLATGFYFAWNIKMNLNQVVLHYGIGSLAAAGVMFALDWKSLSFRFGATRLWMGKLVSFGKYIWGGTLIGNLSSNFDQMLTAKYLLGHATYEGQTVRDSQGQPVLNAEPVLTTDEWNKLQQAVEQRRRGPHRTRDTSPLLGVVKCYKCGENLFHKIYHRDYGKRLYRYYHCRVAGHCAQVDADMLEAELEEAFLESVVKSLFINQV